MLNPYEYFGEQKVILAPMVRFGTLPSRLLALDFGADIVFNEEIVDRLFLRCQKFWNNHLKTYDFVIKDNCPQTNGLGMDHIVHLTNGSNSTSNTTYLEDDVVFRTCPSKEAPKLIFQLGTRDPEKAVLVSRLLVPQTSPTNPQNSNTARKRGRFDTELPPHSGGPDFEISEEMIRANDDPKIDPYHEGPIIAGIDLNMGCPKDYSLKAGIGSALLKSPAEIEVACKVLEALVQENRPKGLYTSCKIRVLPGLAPTLEMCSALQRTGIHAITVHGRTAGEKRADGTANRPDYIAEISRTLSIPVLANGGSSQISSRSEALDYARQCGTSSIMLARSAMKNLSIFSQDPLSRDQVVRQYLDYALRYDMPFVNTKYCVQQMFYHDGKSDLFRRLLKAQSIRDICQLWDCEHLLSLNENFTPQSLPSEFIPTNGTEKCEGMMEGPGKSVRYYDAHFDRRTWNSYKAAIEENDKISGIDLPSGDLNYYRGRFCNPKLALRDLCSSKGWSAPAYEILNTSDQRSFKAVAYVENNPVSTLRWEKSKKVAEQSAAYAALYYALGLGQAS